MSEAASHQTVPRTDLALPRFFAVILFGLAAFMGLPAVAAAVGTLFSGKWRAALLMSAVLPIVWVTAWLGRVLWTGRPIPMWFIYSLGGLICTVPTVGLLMTGEWLGALAMTGLIVPFLVMLCSGMRTTSGTTAKPKAFDDELA